jgi:hypothetical protein
MTLHLTISLSYCIYLRILLSNTISCRLTVSQWVSHGEQELLSLPENLSSPQILVEFVLLNHFISL